MSHYYSPQQDSILQLKKIEAVLRGKKFSFFTGIGVFGKVASTLTKKEVILVDVNARAVELAKMNTKGIDRVKIFVSDAYGKLEKQKFDVILFNPPQSAGKKLCMQMIYDAK